ncbi:DUF5641 domain-containing protein [Aphis craccivora]|uniref:DUF5641 domain-containing protein n=1 Tax=Aphis craccivora TaxID=307492 RepID=A0A6G0YKQ1_APHCR|nr:DUF5641 domain-containing protein [Aphis craccivora]
MDKLQCVVEHSHHFGNQSSKTTIDYRLCSVAAFWRRWSTEYLTTLQERSKWTRKVNNINVNDMVVVVDNHSSPLVWRLGRVIEVTPGTDGVVRVAKVLTGTGPITRPVVKLVPLPVDEASQGENVRTPILLARFGRVKGHLNASDSPVITLVYFPPVWSSCDSRELVAAVPVDASTLSRLYFYVNVRRVLLPR